MNNIYWVKSIAVTGPAGGLPGRVDVALWAKQQSQHTQSAVAVTFFYFSEQSDYLEEPSV